MDTPGVDEVIEGLTPQGMVHRSWMINRGWSSGQINEYLTEHEVKVEGIPQGYSPRFYPLAEVKRVEEQVPEVRKAVEARATIIPALSEVYDLGNTVTRSELLARGWTAAHIKRLLAWPDYVEPIGNFYRYGSDRVQLAEQVDEKLRTRLAKAATDKAEAEAAAAKEKAAAEAQRTATKEAAVQEVVQAGVGVWRRDAGRWLVQTTAAEGEQIEVRRRDGSAEKKIVGQIVRRLDGGQVLATVKDLPRTTPQRPAVEPQVAEPAVPAAWGATRMLTQPAQVGDVIRYANRWCVVTSVRTEEIDDDTSSVYGGDTYGHEGETGWLVRLREATEQEAAPEQARAEQEAQRDALARQERTIIAALVRHARSDGALGSTDDADRGEVLHDTSNIYGSGEVLRLDGETLIHLHCNGMDGDDWSRNNVPGGILRVASAPDELIEQLRTVRSQIQEAMSK